MIVLITDVSSGLQHPSEFELVSFKVVDGEPSISDIERLLKLEIDGVSALSYCPSTKVGVFFNHFRECVKGMHFNSQEHLEHFSA